MRNYIRDTINAHYLGDGSIKSPGFITRQYFHAKKLHLHFLNLYKKSKIKFYGSSYFFFLFKSQPSHWIVVFSCLTVLGSISSS